MADEMDAEMAEVTNGGRRLRLLLALATAMLGENNIIFLSSNCKLPTNDIAKCNACVNKNVSQPTRLLPVEITV